MLFLSQDDVRGLLDVDRLVDALADAHAELTRGEVSMPPRVAALVAQHEALLGVMPAYLPSAGLACKLVTLFPHNTDRETHQAVICIFDPDTGSPLALMDGTHITATRTAAGSALATRLLARDDARVLAVIGTGVQARTHAHAIPRVRDIGEIRVAGRDPDRVRAFAEAIGGTAASSYEEAIRGADIVAATTIRPAARSTSGRSQRRPSLSSRVPPRSRCRRPGPPSSSASTRRTCTPTSANSSPARSPDAAPAMRSPCISP